MILRTILKLLLAACPTNCLQCNTNNGKCDAGYCAAGYGLSGSTGQCSGKIMFTLVNIESQSFHKLKLGKISRYI